MDSGIRPGGAVHGVCNRRETLIALLNGTRYLLGIPGDDTSVMIPDVEKGWPFWERHDPLASFNGYLTDLGVLSVPGIGRMIVSGHFTHILALSYPGIFPTRQDGRQALTHTPIPEFDNKYFAARVAAKETVFLVEIRDIRLTARIVEVFQRTGAQSIVHTINGQESTSATIVEHCAVGLSCIDGKIRVVDIAEDGSYEPLGFPSSPQRIIHAYNFEAKALQTAINELESLINRSQVKELELQRFFEEHPDFLTGYEYKRLHPRIVLSREGADSLIPDFFLEPFNQRRLCDILDLKLPSAQIIVEQSHRNRFSRAVYEACAQLREYNLYFDDSRNQRSIKQLYGLTAYKPRMYVIIGRLGSVDPFVLRRCELDTPQLIFRTYDDVLAHVKGRYNAVKNGERRFLRRLAGEV